jgi:predicted PurR-regulated permease PerM
LAGLAIAAALLALAWSVSATLFASAVFAYLLDPPVSWLQRRGWSREFASILLGIVGLVASVGALLIVVPGVVRQVADLAGNVQPYLDRIAVNLGPRIEWAEQRFGIDIPVSIDEIREHAPEYLRSLSPDVRAGVQDWLRRLATGGLDVVLGLLSLSLLPLFTFYLLVSWPDILGGIERGLPLRWRAGARALAIDVDLRLQAFVRGQLIVAALLGVMYTIGLLLADIDLAITVGLLSGVLFLVPYLGTGIGIVLSSTLAFLKFGLDWHVGVCVGTYVIGQALEGFVLTPVLVGDRVGLHPMVVIVALVVGGNLLGFWGLVLAVPVTATLAVIAGRVLDRYRQSRFYGS